MQVNPKHQTTIDYIFGKIDSIDEQTYESYCGGTLSKIATVKSIETKSEKKLPVPRQRLKEKSRLLPTKAIDIMTEWYEKHYDSPYPSFRECEQMAEYGCISINQVKQWFVNVRRRTQNKNRITRENRPARQQVTYDFGFNSILDLPTKQTNKQCLISHQIEPAIHYNSPSTYPPNSIYSHAYQSQNQLITQPLTYNSNNYPPNYSVSPMLSNHSINYISYNNSPNWSIYSNQSTNDRYESPGRFSDSYYIDSSNNSLDYSNSYSPRITFNSFL